MKILRTARLVSGCRATAATHARKRLVMSAGLLATAAAAVALVPVSAASAAQAPRSAFPGTSHPVTVSEQRAALAFWTRQRIASAKAADIITVRNTGSADPVGPQAKDGYGGKPGIVPGGLPEGYREQAAAGRSAARPGTAFTSYTSFNVPANLYTQWPYRVNGVIAFVFKGAAYQCSGTSVASYHGTSLEDEVWTAGHCVANEDQSSPGVWDTKAVFIPAYNGTAADYDPFGVFPMINAYAPNAWVRNADFSMDEAAMEVGRNAAGQTLGQAVGWEGFIYNQPVNESFVAFGYPAASPYTGNLMVEDLGSSAYTYTPPGATGKPMIGIGDPMTQGSSGGAWNIDWTTGNPGYIDGHNDYHLGSLPNIVFSPYQDATSNTIRCWGASTC